MDAEKKAAEGFGQDHKGKAIDRQTEDTVRQADQQAEDGDQKDTAHKMERELEHISRFEDEEAERGE
eukprot:COSAG04_NODE_18664_length_435_cov_1.035714_1_plen_67_part_00